MAAPDPVTVSRKPIHSLVLDTGPLINNVVSISTIINSAEELHTTPAILSEIRDEATRSRVQTTLVPFLKIRNPSAASYDAVIAFSKKTGDYAVLSKQDLGILALAYEIHGERNGGNWGLREAPKQPIKKKPGDEEAKKDNEPVQTEKRPRKPRKSRKKKATTIKPACEETDEQPVAEGADEQPVVGDAVEQPAVEQGWEQPKGRRAIKSKYIKPAKEQFWQQLGTEDVLSQSEDVQAVLNDETDEQGGVEITGEQILEQEVLMKSTGSEIYDVGNQQKEGIESSAIQDSIQGDARQSTPEQQPTESEYQNEPSQEFLKDTETPVEGIVEQPTSAQDIPESLTHAPEISGTVLAPAGLDEDMADLTLSTQPQDPQQITYDQLTPPATSSELDSDSDSDGSWITPSNLPAHQAKDAGIQTHAQTTKPIQIDVATMTTDFAMQNVLLQMNLHLLSTNMQRIKHLSTKVLRCHACFSLVKDMTKQFCPRCGQATLQRVSCSTNANGEFRVHLAKNYQWNTRGDKYSIPKPSAGTANGKWSGQGGGKGGWGRDLVLAEDQKEFQRSVDVEKRRKARDLMDGDYLPGILTGERRGGGGTLKVGAGRNVNSRKKV